MKYKIDDEVRILSKSVSSGSRHGIGLTGWIVDLRYNGKINNYNDDFYYAVSRIKSDNNTVYHFLERDLELITENKIIAFEWEDFEI